MDPRIRALKASKSDSHITHFCCKAGLPRHFQIQACFSSCQSHFLNNSTAVSLCLLCPHRTHFGTIFGLHFGPEVIPYGRFRLSIISTQIGAPFGLHFGAILGTLLEPLKPPDSAHATPGPSQGSLDHILAFFTHFGVDFRIMFGTILADKTPATPCHEGPSFESCFAFQ